MPDDLMPLPPLPKPTYRPGARCIPTEAYTPEDMHAYARAALAARAPEAGQGDETFNALRALTEAVVTRADNDYMNRQIDAAAKIMAAHGCLLPVPWPPRDGIAAAPQPTAPATRREGGEAQPAPAPFAVHVAGPDDVLSFPTELQALRYANDVNKVYVDQCAKHHKPEDHVLCCATVADAGTARESVAAVPEPFKPETWPKDADGDAPSLCTLCGTPVRYGERHVKCAAVPEPCIRACDDPTRCAAQGQCQEVRLRAAVPEQGTGEASALRQKVLMTVIEFAEQSHRRRASGGASLIPVAEEVDNLIRALSAPARAQEPVSEALRAALTDLVAAVDGREDARFFADEDGEEEALSDLLTPAMAAARALLREQGSEG